MAKRRIKKGDTKKKGEAKSRRSVKPRPAAPVVIQAPPPTVPAERSAAQRHSDQVAARSRENYAAAAEIGPIPEVANPERREACLLDLFVFLQTYFPESTGLNPFSEDHRRAIKRLQTCILRGGRFINAVYRGFAKTSIAENATIWSTVYGHRRFAVIFGESKKASADNLDSIKRELSGNDLLFEDFPEVCYPIRELDDKPQRARHQTCLGEHTLITWRADGIVLPTIAGSKASSAIICTKPFSKARGTKFKRPDGANARPDFAIVDDPQNSDSAANPKRVKKNLDLLRKDIIKTAGHANTIAVVANATVMAKDDLVEQLLMDPAWNGERIPMVKQWADSHDDFWLGEYKETRQRFDPNDPEDLAKAHERANKLYKKNRARADAGCVVSWEYCYDPKCELSAIQHAYNSLIDDGKEVFASECQMQPIDERAENVLLTPAIVRSKANGIKRGILPRESSHLTLYADVHDAILYWTAVALTPDFSGHVVDYGTWPQQPAIYFDQARPPKTLAHLYPTAAGKAAIHAGLTDLCEELLGKRHWHREDGTEINPGRMMIDSKYETDTVKAFCSRSPHRALLFPAQGFYVKPTTNWASYFASKKDGQTGFHWRIPPPEGGVRYVLMDGDWWKDFVAKALAAPIKSPGAWTIFGDPADPWHQLFADHCCAEHRDWQTLGDCGKWHWTNPPGRDNHWWDCLIGCAVAASMLGILVPGLPKTRRAPRRRPGEPNVRYL